MRTGKIQRVTVETGWTFNLTRRLPLPTRGRYTRGAITVCTWRGGGNDGRGQTDTTADRSQFGRLAGRVRCTGPGILGQKAVQRVERRRSEEVHDGFAVG